MYLSWPGFWSGEENEILTRIPAGQHLLKFDLYKFFYKSIIKKEKEKNT